MAAISLSVAAPVLAHDFWIQPQTFRVAPGAALPVTFLVGHGEARERYANNDRIILIADFFDGRRQDRRGQLRARGPADFVTQYSKPGLHIIGMQTNYAFSELPAARFNDYAKEEGLVAVLAARKRDRTLNREGRERYSRRAKALIQVGAPRHSSEAQATRPVGLKLEIVPERNPYALAASRQLPVHVLCGIL